MEPPSSRRSHPAFLTTRWTIIADNTSHGARGQALEWLCKVYWRPLYGHVRRKGHGHEEALDLTQGFFAALLSGEPLAGLDPSRGKFRAWLLGTLNHFLLNEYDRATALKRGGGKPVLALEQLAAADNFWEPEDPALPPDRAFDRRWALTVMEQGLTALETEYAKRGAQGQFELLKPFLTSRTDAGGYESLAEQLGTTANSVAVAVKRLRTRFRERVRQVVQETVGSEENLEEEMAYLLAALRS